jgi:phenolic acid decarboxylase
MLGEQLMELKFDKKQNLEERLKFLRFYVKWVKSVPNEIWSRQQAEFIDSLFENAENFSIKPEIYLKSIKR